MVTFSLIAVALIAVVMIASIYVLPPLLDRLQKKSPHLPRSKFAKALSGPVAAFVVIITIPVLAVMLYLSRPHETGIFPPSVPDTSPAITNPAIKNEKMAPEHAQVVEDMAARLEQNPTDGEGWYMLGHSYAVMGRYAESVIAYEKAAKLLPNNAQLLVDYADVMAVANDRNLRGKPMELVSKALKIDPDNIKGLALFGTAAFQAGDYAGAEKAWKRVLKLLPPDSPFAPQMVSGVAEAQAMAAGKKTPSFGPSQSTAGTAQSEAQAADADARITGVLRLSPALASKAAPNDTVFLSAKELSGSGSPIAVIRAEVKDLPLKFTLDKSTAMMPTMDLSHYQEVMISAKISKSGDPQTASGDLLGEVAPVKVGANGIQVLINKVAP